MSNGVFYHTTRISPMVQCDLSSYNKDTMVSLYHVSGISPVVQSIIKRPNIIQSLNNRLAIKWPRWLFSAYTVASRVISSGVSVRVVMVRVDTKLCAGGMYKLTCKQSHVVLRRNKEDIQKLDLQKLHRSNMSLVEWTTLEKERRYRCQTSRQGRCSCALEKGPI